MRSKLSYIFISLVCLCLICSCAKPQSTVVGTSESEATPSISDAFLPLSEDMGMEYIDSFIFFGESTTYHLKNRAVLSGGKNTTQVWGAKSGTANLDTTISTLRIVYPETGEEITIGEAARRKQPRRMLLTFGLNGAIEKIKRGEEYFRTCYLSLINTIREASPNTRIIIQSCFPIAEDMDMSNYSIDAATLMEYIDLINTWALRLAHDEGLGYLNTCEVLKNDRGFLIEEYNVGDGHHLTREAYLKILEYIRTHADTEEI